LQKWKTFKHLGKNPIYTRSAKLTGKWTTQTQTHSPIFKSLHEREHQKAAYNTTDTLGIDKDNLTGTATSNNRDVRPLSKVLSFQQKYIG
jgi:hypothetical protein